MKINICTINLNEGAGRQTIYWDSEDKLLHTDYDDSEAYGAEFETLQRAEDAADYIWRDPVWGMEWTEFEPQDDEQHDYIIITELGEYGMPSSNLDYVIRTGLYDLTATMSWEVRDESGAVVFTHYTEEDE